MIFESQMAMTVYEKIRGLFWQNSLYNCMNKYSKQISYKHVKTYKNLIKNLRENLLSHAHL